jgi:hypothetical protein
LATLEINWDKEGVEQTVFYCSYLKRRIKNIDTINKYCELTEFKKDERKRKDAKDDKQLRLFEVD